MGVGEHSTGSKLLHLPLKKKKGKKGVRAGRSYELMNGPKTSHECKVIKISKADE